MINMRKLEAELYEKFGEGVYADVLGLSKLPSLSEIEEKGWSLTPGACVGVAPVEDDGVDFAERMAEIPREHHYKVLVEIMLDTEKELLARNAHSRIGSGGNMIGRST